MNEAWKLRGLYFLVFSCTASWLPIFADFLHDHKLSGTQTSIILSAVPLTMFIVQPFYGLIADQLGYKRCLVTSCLFASLSYLLYLLNSSFAGLLAITVVMSLFYNSIQPLLDSLSLQLAEKDNRFSYGSLRLAGAAGWAITGTLVGYSIEQVNTSIIFSFSSVSMGLAFVLSLFLAPSPIKSAARQQHPEDLLSVIQNRQLIFLLVCVLLVSTMGTTIWNFYSLYMKENGASAPLVGYGLSLQGLCEIPLFYFSYRIIRATGIKYALLITVFATALRMFLYSVVDNPYAAIAIETLHGFSWSLFWVVCVEYVNALVDTRWRATGQSLLYASYFGIGAILGNFWTGFLYDGSTKLSQIFLLNAAVVVGVGILITLVMRAPSGGTRSESVKAQNLSGER